MASRKPALRKNLAAAAVSLACANVAVAAEIEEVVVTATRRDQNVSDVPYNITAVSGDDLKIAGVTDIAMLVQRVPSVSYTDRGARGGAFSSGLAMRGISVEDGRLFSPLNTAPAVATYIDETPLYVNLRLSDIDRVEVLRGPQGTLYGSGSMGGTLRFIHNQPSFSAVETEVDADVSQTRNGDGASTEVQLNCKRLGESYIDSTRPQTASRAHFVDRMPLNYLYIGLIHRALPNAKIVHLTRSPMDACFAIYKTLFNQAYPFSYDLSDLGEYYCAYRSLLGHWEAQLPGKILNVSYEALVTDQEYESRRIVEHCGLAWQPECLNFRDNESPTATASAAQVRRGIYRSSVQRWRAYQDQLQPLYRRLQHAGLGPEQW